MLCFRVLLVLLFVSVAARPAVAQKLSRPATEDNGAINLVRTHIWWVSPEAVGNDLRSKDEKVRLSAWERLGLSDEEAHKEVWAQTSPSQVIGREVRFADKVRLTYAALSDDAAEQAILAAEVESQMYVAVATPVKGGGWERIAVANCWCKYDWQGDALSEFVHVEHLLVPGQHNRFQLVIRASGGGTGVYGQDEGHFIIHRGELHRVLFFRSRYRICPPTEGTPMCTVERRWFYPVSVNGSLVDVLVEGYGRFPGDGQTPAFWAVRDLEIRKLQRIKCTSYQWDEQRLRYVVAKGIPVAKTCLSAPR